MACAVAADVAVAAGRGERLENRLVAPEDIQLAADHQAVAKLESPDAAASADIHQVQLHAGEYGSAADVIVKVGVAAVDDRVAGLEQFGQLINRAVGGI